MVESISETNSIFQQPWWLDALARGHWDAAVVKRGDTVVARLPFVVKKRLGFTILTMPKLTQTLGPWLFSSEAKYSNRLSEEVHLCEDLISKLPRYDFFIQQFSPAITNWLAFYWAGFTSTTHYTYRIEDLTDLDRIWSELRSNIRGKIRKAQAKVKIRDDLGIDSFLSVASKTFLRQGTKVPYDAESVRRLDRACAQHDARQILFAEDAQRHIHGVGYLVWDSSTAYYLMSGGDPSLRESGAQSLLLWEAIKFAASKTRCFDFEGSMLAPVESFFRAFGARQVPYFRVTNASRRMQLAMGVGQVVSALIGRPLIPAFDT
jgi:Acetyltransferase (GNAT) domain